MTIQVRPPGGQILVEYLVEDLIHVSLTTEDVWQCGKCKASFPNDKVLNLLFKIYEQMEVLMNNPSEGPTGLEAFLTKFSRVLSDGNGLLQRVRYF